MCITFYSKYIVFHKLCKTYIFTFAKLYVLHKYMFLHMQKYIPCTKHTVLHKQNNYIVLQMYMVFARSRDTLFNRKLQLFIIYRQGVLWLACTLSEEVGRAQYSSWHHPLTRLLHTQHQTRRKRCSMAVNLQIYRERERERERENRKREERKREKRRKTEWRKGKERERRARAMERCIMGVKHPLKSVKK